MSWCLDTKVVETNGIGRECSRELAWHCAGRRAAVIVSARGLDQASEGGNAAPAKTKTNEFITSDGWVTAFFGDVVDLNAAVVTIEDELVRC